MNKNMFIYQLNIIINVVTGGVLLIGGDFNMDYSKKFTSITSANKHLFMEFENILGKWNLLH